MTPRNLDECRREVVGETSAVGDRATTFSSWGEVIVVWRYLDYEFKKNNASLSMSGPAIGFGLTGNQNKRLATFGRKSAEVVTVARPRRDQRARRGIVGGTCRQAKAAAQLATVPRSFVRL